MKVRVYLLLFQAVLIRFNEHFAYGEILDLRAVVEKLPDWKEVKESIYFPSLAARELDKSLSIWPWSVNMSCQSCLHVPRSRVYTIYFLYVLRCLRSYYRYCVPLAKDAVDMPESILGHARECGNITFS